ncbi:transposase [Fulvivirga kasyanovii]|uniref:Transposase n=1 Tax=Fulvivirga kasyanovii TaxID=396812 RepID=A0ABW9RVJ3_9BACT|nr:transposase [Fulvivirga kasyanovii]MTI28259.1 transposase [Fulvivirga kasyanovii]
MSRKYKFQDQSKLYFVSFATVYWIDLFVREDYNNILIESLKYCQKEKGLEIYAWCIMPSHVHLIIGTEDKPMQDILRDFKSFTSRKLKKEIQNHPSESRREWIKWMMERAGNKNGNNNGWQLWQQHNHPIELSDNKMMEQRLNYLHMNPVVAGFVSEPSYWKYSSALDYSGGKGLLNILFIE